MNIVVYSDQLVIVVRSASAGGGIMQKDVCVFGFGGAESLMAMSYMASKEWGWG